MIIVKPENKKTREFKEVSFDILVSGEKTMFIKMNYKNGVKIQLQSHPKEQSGYVISGEYVIHYGDITERIKPCDSYCIPENVDHSWAVLQAGEVIDIFTQPRMDYL